MKDLRLGIDKIIEGNIIKYVRNLFRLKKEQKYMTLHSEIQEIFLDWWKKLKQPNIKYLDILKTFSSMKKIIANQQDYVVFGIITTLNMKLMLVEIKDYQLKNTILDLGQI